MASAESEGGVVRPPALRSRAGRVRTILAELDRPATIPELASLVGEHPLAVEDTMSQMLRRGHVRRAGRATDSYRRTLWALADADEPDDDQPPHHERCRIAIAAAILGHAKYVRRCREFGRADLDRLLPDRRPA